MTETAPVTFLVDVDNTLLDNDRVIADLRQHLVEKFGVDRQQHYWTIFEALREELGYADYLGAIQRYRREEPDDLHFPQVSLYLLDYPFADRVYDGALAAIRWLKNWGPTALLTDGDAVFQPRKIDRSGLWQAVEGHVLIAIHKERELEAVERNYPSRQYVVIDDKLRILSAIKQAWGSRVTTVFVRQGHYATDPKEFADYPPADLAIDKIRDLCALDRGSLIRS